MKVIYEKIELIKEEERTELQEYALGVAGNLLEIIKDKKENLEKLFNYTTELAEANSGSKVFLSEYNKNKDSITELHISVNIFALFCVKGRKKQKMLTIQLLGDIMQMLIIQHLG